MSGFIIGTCGHVDHGKTALVRALNGFEGDTLKEEKKRGITIDLSFSHMQKEGKQLSFIDVPGHETLVKTMISGAFGFDMVLIVVSAVEGVMPQTVEHLQILRLLGIKEAILAVTKKDLIAEDTLDARIKEIAEDVASFGLHLHDTLSVSIYDEMSIGRLRERLFAVQSMPRTEGHFFRLYADRVFTLKGVGMVVTGTVLGKAVRLDDKLIVCDSAAACRLKGMQVHGENVQEAQVSERVALNLAGTDAKKIRKGDLISPKGYLRGFRQIDVVYEDLSKKRPLQHDRTYTIYIGAKRLEAKVTLYALQGEKGKGFATLHALKDIFAIYGERMILREGNRTVAGATVLCPVADPLRKKQKEHLLEALDRKDIPKAYGILLEAHKHGLGMVSSVQRFGLSQVEALAQADLLENVFVDEKALIVYPLKTQKELVEHIGDIYRKNPYALLSVSSLNLRLPWASEGLIDSALKGLEKQGVLREEKNLYASAQMKEDLVSVLKERVLLRLKKDDITPSAPANIFDTLDMDRRAGEKILLSLCSQKEAVRLQHNLFIHTQSLSKIILRMRKIIEQEGYIDIKNFKEHIPLSRKYLIAYLEYLDSFSDILKEGNRRRYFN